MKIEQKIKNLEDQLALAESNYDSAESHPSVDDIADAYAGIYHSAKEVAESALKLLKSEVEEVERLKSLIRNVCRGRWCVTELQESIGDI